MKNVDNASSTASERKSKTKRKRKSPISSSAAAEEFCDAALQYLKESNGGLISFKRKNSSSQYLGVMYIKSQDKWRAQICIGGKKISRKLPFGD